MCFLVGAFLGYRMSLCSLEETKIGPRISITFSPRDLSPRQYCLEWLFSRPYREAREGRGVHYTRGGKDTGSELGVLSRRQLIMCVGGGNSNAYKMAMKLEILEKPLTKTARAVTHVLQICVKHKVERRSLEINGHLDGQNTPITTTTH